MLARPLATPLGTLLMICSLLVASATAYASHDIPEHTAIYTLKKGPMELGRMTRTLTKQANGHYLYQSYSKPVGIARWFTKNTLTETSEWVFHNDELRPMLYRYDRVGDKKKERHVKMEFNWKTKKVTTTVNDDPWKMAISNGTLDKLLYQLALSFDLEQGKKTFNYQVADGGSLKKYNFEFLGEEEIATPLGTFNTLKFKRKGKRDTLIWCAPALKHLPIRIEQSENGKTLQLRLRELEGISPDNAQPSKTTPEIL